MRTIILDLDGTIIDTCERQYQVYLDSIAATSSTAIEQCLSKDTFWANKRTGKRTVELLPSSFSSELVEDFENEWLSRIERRDYLLYDDFHTGAEEALSRLEQQEIRLVLATHRTRETNARWQLKQLGIYDVFEDVYVIPHDGESKSAWLMREESGFPDGSVFIGDSESDITAARRLNITSIAVSSGIRSSEKLQQFSPDEIADHLVEAVDILIEDR